MRSDGGADRHAVRGTADEAEVAQAKYLQRAPIGLDADLGAVIGVLDAAEGNSELD